MTIDEIIEGLTKRMNKERGTGRGSETIGF